MADKSSIEWCDATWNAITGCSQIPGPHGSPSGCDNRYAKRLNDTRLIANPKIARYGKPFETVLCHEDRLDQPLRWKAPRRIFVNSLSDMFHVDVPREFIDKMLAVMSLCPQHTFQILTKRPDRMRAYFDDFGNRYETIEDIAVKIGEAHGVKDAYERYYRWLNAYSPNVWLGTSICSNVDAWRADVLRKTAPHVRFLSVEPMLGPVGDVDLTGIQWVIAGGESGPGARPMHQVWALELRDRCIEAGIPYFFKQWGEHKPLGSLGSLVPLTLGTKRSVVFYDGEHFKNTNQPPEQWPSLERWQTGRGELVERVGKKNAGRLLGGREWNEFPKVEAA